MQNDATVCLTPADMQKIMTISGHEVEIIDFGMLVGKEGAQQEPKVKKNEQEE